MEGKAWGSARSTACAGAPVAGVHAEGAQRVLFMIGIEASSAATTARAAPQACAPGGCGGVVQPRAAAAHVACVSKTKRPIQRGPLGGTHQG